MRAAWHRLLDRAALGAGAVRRRARDAAVRARAARGLPLPRRGGDGWAMLPSAAGVIDPLLSTGFPLTLLGIGRLVDLLERTWTGSGVTPRSAGTRNRRRTSSTRPSGWWRRSTQHGRLRALQAAQACSTSRPPATARPCGGWAAELAPGFLLYAHPRLVPASRASPPSRLRSDRPRAREPARSRSTARSSPSTRPASSTIAARLVSGARRGPHRRARQAGRERAGDPHAAGTLRLRAAGVARDCRLRIADCRLRIPQISRMWRQGFSPAD